MAQFLLVSRRNLILFMALDPKVEKRIDTLYRTTRQMPLLTILGLFIPLVLLIGGPLGLMYWFWRRGLLQAADSGSLELDSVPPPLPGAKQSGELSPAAKLEYIRNHKHTLLLPGLVLAVVVILIGGLICFTVVTHHRQ